MNYSRRVLRATVGVASLAALGLAFAGTAYAASDPDDVYPQCSPVYDPQNYSGLMYNGNSSDDENYDSDDYDPDCTGFHGKSEDNGYNGYDGKDQERLDENHYRFAPL
jgi:hypothetical protein